MEIVEAIKLLDETPILIKENCVEYNKALNLAKKALKDVDDVLNEYRHYAKLYNDLAAEFCKQNEELKQLKGIKNEI